ncbi:membrane protein [Chlamydia psittaci]|uniref:membrane protein n=1 Tax=Chlamydia psittaci TaxID=83554 RepID=UPI00027E129D|nr:membrane protein [Chlamydia psittaci]AFS24450.1 putative membrane protein [Chlamydia psittaci M56]
MANTNPLRNQSTTDLSPIFSPREVSTKKWDKILKITSLSILGTLTIGTGVAGITLAIVLGMPALALLAVSSVLLAIVTVGVYKYFQQKADGDWSGALNQHFRTLPEQSAQANFLVSPGAHLSFHQNKKNPGVKLGIQESVTPGFTIKFLALPRSNTFKTVTSQSGIAFNALLPASQTLISQNSNQSRLFFRELLNLGQTSQWSASQYQGDTSIKLPFGPTEARSTKLSIKDSPTMTHPKKENFPEYIGHVRGPRLEEFSGEDDEVVNDYYNRALFAYENCLEEAINRGCSIVSVPLFSSVYEIEHRDEQPKQNRNYEWILNCNELCKKALIEAIDKIACSNPNSLRLLVLLQDPFAPLA